MKKLILTSLVAGLAAVAYGQGQLSLNNSDNNFATVTPTSTSGGAFYLDTGSGPNKITVDFNAVFITGTTTIASFIGAGANGDVTTFGTPGQFFDLSGNNYTFGPNGTIPLTIQAWLGSATDYASAVTKGTATYNQRISDSTLPQPPPAATLVDMPSIILQGGATPEPSTFALAGLGAAALLIFRRRK